MAQSTRPARDGNGYKRLRCKRDKWMLLLCACSSSCGGMLLSSTCSHAVISSLFSAAASYSCVEMVGDEDINWKTITINNTSNAHTSSPWRDGWMVEIPQSSTQDKSSGPPVGQWGLKQQNKHQVNTLTRCWMTLGWHSGPSLALVAFCVSSIAQATNDLSSIVPTMSSLFHRFKGLHFLHVFSASSPPLHSALPSIVERLFNLNFFSFKLYTDDWVQPASHLINGETFDAERTQEIKLKKFDSKLILVGRSKWCVGGIEKWRWIKLEAKRDGWRKKKECHRMHLVLCNPQRLIERVWLDQIKINHQIYHRTCRPQFVNLVFDS